jgi:NitT/TauT family transport system permease protein
VSNPSRIAAAFVTQFQSGEILADLKVTMIEFAIGFGMALVIGMALGVAMGLNRLTEYAIDPFVWFLYSSPLIAFYPLIIVWLGFGFATVVAVTFLLSFVSVVVNTMAGVHSVDPQLVRAVRAFGGKKRDVIVKVILPASLPLILAGTRIGLGRALHGVVLGEMFSSNAGLGYRITYYAAHLRTADVFVPLVILVVIGILINQLSYALETRLRAWRT